SQENDQEIVHCQGQAVLSLQGAPVRLDLDQLKGRMGQGQLLARLRLPRAVEDTLGDYWLHPSLMGGAMQACVGLIDGSSESSKQPRLPVALESLRVVSPCSREMVAWARYSPGSQAWDASVKLDLDLCDEQGNIAAQMRGVNLQRK